MTSTKEIAKLKVVLDKLKEKKRSVETNYFLATKKIKDLSLKTGSIKEKEKLLLKQAKLDEATNFAIQSLDKIISQIYSVLIEILKNNQLQVKKVEEADKILKAQQHTQQQQTTQNVIPTNFDDIVSNVVEPATSEPTSDIFQESPSVDLDKVYESVEETTYQPTEEPVNIFDTVDVEPQTVETQPEEISKSKIDDLIDQAIQKHLDKTAEELNNVDNIFTIDDSDLEDYSKLNVADDSESVLNVKTNKLDEVTEVKDEVFSPTDFIDVNDETSKEILKQIDALDSMNEKDIDVFLNQVSDDINNLNAPQNVKAGLMNDSQYVFDTKLKEIEDKFFWFNNEIEQLKTENKTLNEVNDTLFDMINKKNEDAQLNTSLSPVAVPNATQYFAALDNSVDNAITKLEAVATNITPFLNAISEEQIKNLENLSMPLIKSLERTLENLSEDIKVLKQENTLYRKQIAESSDVINALREEKAKRDLELNVSYNSWMSNNRKLSDLEAILSQQAYELESLDGSKNDIIESLENKLTSTKILLDDVIAEKEDLINRNEKLVESFESLKNSVLGEYSNEELEAVSLQELIEKEANKIVDIKLSSLLKEYRNEIETIKSDSLVGLYVNEEDPSLPSFEEAIKDANPDELTILQNRVADFENKISELEDKIRKDQRLKEKTSETIDELNSMLGIPNGDEYAYNGSLNNIVNSKLFALEQKIGETLRKIDEIEEREKQERLERENQKLSPEELNQLVVSSELYQNIRNELSVMEGRVIELKQENEKVKIRNELINNDLEDSFQKFAFNTAKMKEIQELLLRQNDEFEALLNEKDELIDILEKALLDKDYSKTTEFVEKWSNPEVEEFIDENADSKKSIEEIEDLVNKRVNEIIADKFDELTYKYASEIDAINNRYALMSDEYQRLMSESENKNPAAFDQQILDQDPQLFVLDTTPVQESEVDKLNTPDKYYGETNAQDNESNQYFSEDELSDIEAINGAVEVTDVEEDLNGNNTEQDENSDLLKWIYGNNGDDKVIDEKEISSVITTPEPQPESEQELQTVESVIETKTPSVEDSNLAEQIKDILANQLQESIKSKDIVGKEDTIKNLVAKNNELEQKIYDIQKAISDNFKNFEQQLKDASVYNNSTLIQPVLTSENAASFKEQFRELFDEAARIKWKEFEKNSTNFMEDMKQEIKEALINEQLRQSEALQKSLDESFKQIGASNKKELRNIKDDISNSIELREVNRNLIQELGQKISELEEENSLIKISNAQKDAEIDSSYIAWSTNSKKLQELEDLFVVLQNEMIEFEDDKNDFLNFLEQVAQRKIKNAQENNVIGKKFDNTSNRYFEDNIKPTVYYELDEKLEELNKDIDAGVGKFATLAEAPQESIYNTLDGIDNIIKSQEDSDHIDSDKINNYIEQASNDLFENRRDEMFNKYGAILEEIEARYEKIKHDNNQAIEYLSDKLKNIEEKVDTLNSINYTPPISTIELDINKSENVQLEEMKVKLDNLQKSYDELLDKTRAFELEKADLSLNVTSTVDDNSNKYLISQLIESTAQLRRFEKMLLDLDGEISNLESQRIS